MKTLVGRRKYMARYNRSDQVLTLGELISLLALILTALGIGFGVGVAVG